MVKSKTINDLHELMSASVEVQRQMLRCLENIESRQQGDESLGLLKKEMLKWILSSSSVNEALVDDLDHTSSPQKKKNTLSTAKKDDLVNRTNSPTAKKTISGKKELVGTSVYQHPMKSTRLTIKTEEGKKVIDVPPARYRIPCSDDDRRDILKTPTQTGSIHFGKRVRIQGLLTKLLSETKGREKINSNSAVVLKSLVDLNDAAKDIHAHMMYQLSQENNETLKQSLALMRWSMIPFDIQDKYCLLFEKFALENYGLDIGRCRDMWGSRAILSDMTSKRNDRRSISHGVEYIEDHVKNCHGRCDVGSSCIIKNENVTLPFTASGSSATNNKLTGNSNRKAVPMVIPAHNEDDDSENSNDDGDDQNDDSSSINTSNSVLENIIKPMTKKRSITEDEHGNSTNKKGKMKQEEN